MLEELKKLNFQGGKEGLLFFLKDIIGKNTIDISDAKIICTHTPGKRYLSVDELCSYCIFWGWVYNENGLLKVSEEIIDYLGDADTLNSFLIEDTVKQLFKYEVFSTDMFSFDSINHQYYFKNQLFPLALSSVRNTLISQGFISPLRNNITRFYINPHYEGLIAEYCKNKRKRITLEKLRKKLEENDEAGERAELFVLNYEKQRLGNPLCEKIKRISEIDVTAGYDIISFNSTTSNDYDRYIEVKAVSDSGFYWSKNEYEIAKLYSEKYYIYLVSLKSIGDADYKPEIIINPAKTVMTNDEWFVESQSFRIKKI